jgi:membrane protease YdiL (CAAX protease family)
MFTSITFALWHISAVTLQTGFDLPAAQIPVFLADAAVMGAIWGVLREISGSLVASSVSHGVWNGLAYALFGYGTKVGALGIRHTAIYGPEVGLLGLALNALVLVAVVKTLNKPEPNANILYFSA